MEKANRFAQHHENVFQPNPGEKLPDWDTPAQRAVNIGPISSKEVAKEIK